MFLINAFVVTTLTAFLTREVLRYFFVIRLLSLTNLHFNFFFQMSGKVHHTVSSV